jgi:polyhydroxybutyrate depolymerase
MIMTRFLAFAPILAAVAAACSSGSASSAGPVDAAASDGSAVDSSAADASAADSSSSDADAGGLPPWTPDATPPDAAAIVAARPYTVHVPKGYDPTQRTPLLVLFHGYGFTGALQDAYMGLDDASDTHGFLLAYGDGTLDQDNKRFWNATDACCDLYGVPVDDVAYFNAIVDDVTAKYDVDPHQIFVIGHSNGGFMGHRLACEPGSRVAAIVSLAGDVFLDPSKCAPTSPVSILEVHGDADTTIVYTGGSTKEGTYPSVLTTMATWAAKEGCTGTLAPTGQTLTVDSSQPPGSTLVETYGGCPAGIDVQHWKMQGSGHIPGLQTPTWGDLAWGFLSAHPKR